MFFPQHSSGKGQNIAEKFAKTLGNVFGKFKNFTKTSYER